MTQNAVLLLRAERLVCATRPLPARGHRIERCQRCLLPRINCLCSGIVTQQANCRFCLIMSDTEPMKPSNTGRLIADILPDTLAYSWSRTKINPDLLLAITDVSYQPFVVFPASYASAERQFKHKPLAQGKLPLFIMLDGTWRQARRMFHKSPWLDQFPVMSVNVTTPSAYCLREAHASGQHCTAEVAIALLTQAGDLNAAQALSHHFLLFRDRYLAGKPLRHA